jgi:hypothetical protein
VYSKKILLMATATGKLISKVKLLPENDFCVAVLRKSFPPQTSSSQTAAVGAEVHS